MKKKKNWETKIKKIKLKWCSLSLNIIILIDLWLWTPSIYKLITEYEMEKCEEIRPRCWWHIGTKCKRKTKMNAQFLHTLSYLWLFVCFCLLCLSFPYTSYLFTNLIQYAVSFNQYVGKRWKSVHYFIYPFHDRKFFITNNRMEFTLVTSLPMMQIFNIEKMISKKIAPSSKIIMSPKCEARIVSRKKNNFQLPTPCKWNSCQLILNWKGKL